MIAPFKFLHLFLSFLHSCCVIWRQGNCLCHMRSRPTHDRTGGNQDLPVTRMQTKVVGPILGSNIYEQETAQLHRPEVKSVMTASESFL